MTPQGRLILAREMARSVGTRPDTPEHERAAAVRRIWQYTDALRALQEQRQ